MRSTPHAIIDNLLTGTEERAYSPFPAGYDPPIGNLPGQYNYDPDKARALLEEAGQIGFAFTITLPTGLWTADRIWMPAVQQMLNDVGFQVEIDYADFGNALALIRNNELPHPLRLQPGGRVQRRAARSGLRLPVGDDRRRSLLARTGKRMTSCPSSSEFQALIEEANAEFDQQRANDLYYAGVGDLVRERVPGAAVRSAAPLRGHAADILYNEYYDTSTGLNAIYAQKLKT